MTSLPCDVTFDCSQGHASATMDDYINCRKQRRSLEGDTTQLDLINCRVGGGNSRVTYLNKIHIRVLRKMIGELKGNYRSHVCI